MLDVLEGVRAPYRNRRIVSTASFAIVKEAKKRGLALAIGEQKLRFVERRMV
jgi:hypothetical protein